MGNVLIESFLKSDWFGKTIVIALFILSIFAWAIIAMKWRMFKDIAGKKNHLFKILGRTQGNILSIYQKGNQLPNSPFHNLYEIICEELNTMLDTNIREGKPKKITNIQFNNIYELADLTVSNQIISLEKYLVLLATATSISPLLGLLGTVWGILVAFMGIASFGSANLIVIAPGIAEALVTTVVGLLVAIPALIGYNWITNKVELLTKELENFSTKLLSHIQSIYSIPAAYEKEPAY